jgi:5-methyltetrahydrofolate--homocysteine methyltransferase
MLEGQGIECLDLGVDVSSQTIVEAVKEYHPDLLCLSALLATTMMEQKVVIEALNDAGLRNQVIILLVEHPSIGSLPMKIGADGYAVDAASAAELARKMLLKEVPQ